MKIEVFGLKIKLGLIVTIIIAGLMIFYQYQLISCYWMIRLAFAGTPNYCSLARSLDVFSYTARIRDSAEKVYSHAKLLSHDSIGLDQYQIGSEKIWVGSKSLWSIAFESAEQEVDIYQNNAVRIRPGDVVLDAGAHVGLFSKRALRAKAATVIAIDPSPLSVESLKRNLEGEIASGRVIVFPKGVWNRNDILEMSENEGESGRDSFVLKGNKATKLKLPLTTIDELTSELGLAHVDFIKMDIEGSEKQALQGAESTIKRFHPRMAICVYHLPEDPVLIPQIIKGFDSSYRQECGVCGLEKNKISPQVYFFY